VPLFLQSIEGLTAEVEDMRRQPSPLAAAQAAKQEVLADQRKFQEVIAGNQVCFLCCADAWVVSHYLRVEKLEATAAALSCCEGASNE
jgi:hypothetical protein